MKIAIRLSKIECLPDDVCERCGKYVEYTTLYRAYYVGWKFQNIAFMKICETCYKELNYGKVD